MNELPDDLRAFEASLSQISPKSSLDTDRLIFESGYAAAIADRKARQTARATVTIVGSALAGVAATLMAVFALRTQDPPMPPSAAVANDTQRQDASPSTDVNSESPRVAERRAWPASSPRSPLIANEFVEASADSFGTLRWRQRLIQSAGDGDVALDILPDSFPSRPAASEPRAALPTNLQWQRELLRDDSSREWVNS